jgi:hypothetical protein
MKDIELEQIRKQALQAIAPLRPGEIHNYFWGQRTNAGRILPPYYIVYFLLADLLHFPTTGQHEKVAWSIVLELEGRTFIVEHRKMGLGVFVKDLKEDEIHASRIVNLITDGVKISEKYFDWLAEIAIRDSKLNLLNKSRNLFGRLQYFLDLYRKLKREVESRKDEPVLDALSDGKLQFRHPSHYDLEREADWLAMSAIEAFFSWTEHLFIHFALLNGSITTGAEAADLAEGDWSEKFKMALDISSDSAVKKFYDEFILIRRQVRNFVAHGAFGKRGGAFDFHSKAGAVPVMMPHKSRDIRFSMFGDLSFREEAAISVIEKFIELLRTGKQATAFKYVQESELPTVLTYVTDGTYKAAMSSMESVDVLIDSMHQRFDRAANMDW